MIWTIYKINKLLYINFASNNHHRKTPTTQIVTDHNETFHFDQKNCKTGTSAKLGTFIILYEKVIDSSEVASNQETFKGGRQYLSSFLHNSVLQ